MHRARQVRTDSARLAPPDALTWIVLGAIALAFAVGLGMAVGMPGSLNAGSATSRTARPSHPSVTLADAERGSGMCPRWSSIGRRQLPTAPALVEINGTRTSADIERGGSAASDAPGLSGRDLQRAAAILPGRRTNEGSRAPGARGPTGHERVLPAMDTRPKYVASTQPHRREVGAHDRSDAATSPRPVGSSRRRSKTAHCGAGQRRPRRGGRSPTISSTR